MVRISIWVIFLALFGCDTANTILVYQAPDKLEKPSKVGYSQFAFEEKIEYRGKGSIRCYDSTMAVVFTESDIAYTKIHIPDFKELDKVDTDYLKRQCAKHGLDGIFLTDLKLEAVYDSNYGFGALEITMECHVNIQYVKNNGELIAHTKGFSSSSLGKNLDEKAYYAVSGATEATMWRILKALQ